MSDTPFLGELRLMSFNFAPRGWAQCNGQLLPINQNQPLFSLFGTAYGGDGRVNFGLPDLRGRAPVHIGGSGGFVQGDLRGEEFHTLTVPELPAHTHPLKASSTNANQSTLGIPAAANNLYRAPSDPVSLHPSTVTSYGGGQPHENRQPALALCWCVALVGIFPSRN
jgi:microcystin-dependent protein